MRSTFAQQIGAAVRTMRARHHLSQSRVAADGQLSVQTLRHIERGRLSMQTRTIEQIARGLQTTVDALVLEAIGAHQQTADPLLYIPIPVPPGNDLISHAYVVRHVRTFLRRLNLLPTNTPR